MGNPGAVHFWLRFSLHERCGPAAFLGTSAHDSPRHLRRGYCFPVVTGHVRHAFGLVGSWTVCLLAESAGPRHACYNGRSSRRLHDIGTLPVLATATPSINGNRHRYWIGDGSSNGVQVFRSHLTAAFDRI